MKVVYMGTPDFAVKPLLKIHEAGHEILGVYTQPDRQKGRGKKFLPSDVKVAAEGLGLEIFQPEKLRDASEVERLKGMNPDIIVVAAYGQILSEDILNIPKYGCINIHASLLPKYRGASPIEASILNGDEKTGITIMYMAKGLDTGDIISQAEIEIGKHNTESLTAALSEIGADLVVRTMDDIQAGNAKRIPQKDEESSYSGKLDKAMGRMVFEEDAAKLERLIRGLYPWPCAFTEIEGKSVKILDADVIKTEELSDEKAKEMAAAEDVPAGTVIEVTKKYFLIKCKKDVLKINKLQPEGKKPMETVAFLNGYRLQTGVKVG